MLRYDPAFQDGKVEVMNAVNRKILARIAPETRELLQAAAYGHVKAIAQTDMVTLSGSEAPDESSVAQAALDALDLGDPVGNLALRSAKYATPEPQPAEGLAPLRAPSEPARR